MKEKNKLEGKEEPPQEKKANSTQSAAQSWIDNATNTDQ